MISTAAIVPEFHAFKLGLFEHGPFKTYLEAVRRCAALGGNPSEVDIYPTDSSGNRLDAEVGAVDPTDNEWYWHGYGDWQAALPRDQSPSDYTEEKVGYWLAGWDAANSAATGGMAKGEAPVEESNPALDALRENQNPDALVHVKERQERQTRYLWDKFGINMGPTVVAAGTAVVDMGHQNFARSRRQWEKAGVTADNLEGIEAAVEAEQRIDVRGVTLAELRMAEDGRIFRASTPHKLVGIEEVGLRSLLGSTAFANVFGSASDHFLALPAKIRARHFNEAVDVWSDKNGETDTITLRTRLGKKEEGSDEVGRAIYAAVGDTYTVFDTDRVANLISKGLRQQKWSVADQPHGSAIYNPAKATLRAEALFHADKIVDLSAGDTFKGGILFRADDKGGGSIRGDIVIFRNQCVNLIIIAKGVGNLFRFVHHGDITEEAVSAAIADALPKVDAFINAFAEDWGLLRNTPIHTVDIYGEKYTTVPDAIRALCKAGRISEGLARDATVQAILECWQLEAGQTAADLVNAVTRFAHQGGEKVLVPVHKGEKIEEDVGGTFMPDLVKFARRAAA